MKDNTKKMVIADKILECVEKSITRYGINTPYKSSELSEGQYSYIRIQESEYGVYVYLYEEMDFSKDKYTIPELKEATDSEIKELLTILEQKITQNFFDEAHTGKFEYQLHCILEFGSGYKEFFLVDEARKAELKQHYDTYVNEVIIQRTRKMQEHESAIFIEKAFDFQLTGYTENQLIEVLQQGLKAVEALRKKKFAKGYRRSVLLNCNLWKKKVFLPLYYHIEKVDFYRNNYTLKEGVQVDAEKLHLYVQQALWNIQEKQYSWDVTFGKEDLERAVNDFGSAEAKMYLKKGTGTLPDSIIHYKDEALECKANDVFATISVSIKQETASAYSKVLDFITTLLQNNFPRSYEIKFSSKAAKQFLNIRGIAKTSTHRFFAQALQYEELRPKLAAYAQTAMVEFEWYTDVEPGEKSCMPGSYAVFGLGLTDEAYFPLVQRYFKLLDDEHQMIHKYFVEALISRYGVTAESLPVICDGIASAQFTMVYKELKKALEQPEAKALLEVVLKGKSASYKEEVYRAIK